MWASVRSVYRSVPPDCRMGFFGIAGLSVLVGLLEMFGVASVMPLVAIMVDPARLEGSTTVRALLHLFGLTHLPAVHIVGLFTISVFILSTAASLWLAWWTNNYVAAVAVSLSERLARAHFLRPFSFFMVNAPADLAHQTCNEVGRLAAGGVLQLCTIMVRVVQAILILALLLAVSPVLSGVFFATAAVLYGLIYRFSAGHITSSGKRWAESSSQAAVAATDMYSAAREILLLGECRYFVARMARALKESHRAEAVARILPILSKYALEVLAVCAIFSLPIYRSLMGEDVKADLPFLATFGYAGFRLLPMLQQIYASAALLRYNQPTAERVTRMIDAPRARAGACPALDRMPQRIEFRNLSYRYPGREDLAVSRLSFEIARGDRIAVVGDSGAGKSTLADLVLGLLEPEDGEILIGGAKLDGPLAWKAGVVGYVPQTPLLLNDSLARNIAFGVPDDAIDEARCRDAAALAEIAVVIEGQKSGLDSVVGSAGVNFSGGERQRLGIARALYTRPELLVLDEPASALDPPMARKIFDLVTSPRLPATVLVMTHDLDHLGRFDKVLFIRRGVLVMAASYDRLMRDCAEFRHFRGDLLARSGSA